MAPHEPVDLLLRPAEHDDLTRIHEILVTAGRASGHPADQRPPGEVRSWVLRLLESPFDTWVAQGEDSVTAFVALRGAWVTSLFVDPQRARTGVGTALLELVRALRPDGFGLRVHQANTVARTFYRRTGLVELEQTDGSGHLDGSPDVQMVWLGADPLGYLRGRIDEVDQELAVLLAQRVALTGAAQDHKVAGGQYAGQAGRDAARETEIVDRMARHVPGLRRELLARVMHTLIAESLADWEGGS